MDGFMKKANRLKQKIGRSDKGAVLNESEQEQARRVETMVRVVSDARSVLKPLVTTSSSDHDKRVRKMPETAFANTFDELHASLTKAGFARAIAAVLGQIGIEEHAAADARVDWEVGVEQVLKNLDFLDKQQLPEIKQLGRKLENSRLDLEAARSSSNNAREKYQSLQQQAAELGEPTEPSASAAPGTKLSPLQQAREQMEATRVKADEQEQRLLEIKFLEYKRSYHHRCLLALDDALASIQVPMDTASKGPVFGVDLETHLKKQECDCSLAVVLEMCLGELFESRDYLEEGLFRLAGSEMRIRRLRKEFDECVRQTDLQQQEGSDANLGETGGASASAAHACNPHVLAGVAKRYLRELPEPLLCTSSLGNTWLSVAQSIGKKSPDAVVQQLREAVAQLPPAYVRNLAYLMDFCALVAAHADQNKMSPANLAICIGPNLVPQRPAPPSPPPPVDWTFVVNPIAEQLIVHFDQVFPPEYRSERFRKARTESQSRVVPQSELPSAPAAPVDPLGVPMRATKRAPMTSPPPPPPASQGPEAAASAQKAPTPTAPHPEAANEQIKKRPANYNPFDEEDATLALHAPSEFSVSTDALSGGSASGPLKQRASGHLLPADESASSSQQAKRSGSLREARSGSGTATPPDSLESNGGLQEKVNPFSPPARPPPPRNSAGPGASNSLNVSSPELRRPDAQAYATNQQQAAAQPVERSSSGPSVEPQ